MKKIFLTLALIASTSTTFACDEEQVRQSIAERIGMFSQAENIYVATGSYSLSGYNIYAYSARILKDALETIPKNVLGTALVDEKTCMVVSTFHGGMKHVTQQ